MSKISEAKQFILNAITIIGATGKNPAENTLAGALDLLDEAEKEQAGHQAEITKLKAFEQKHIDQIVKEAEIFEKIINRIGKEMIGYHWQFEKIVKKPDLKDFKRQECESGDFEFELVAQYGTSDSGYYGKILFPIAQKFIEISWWE